MAVRLLRTWGAMCLAGLPVLIVLLIPALQRSRAGSGALLAVGVTVLLTLVVLLVVVAPLISAIVAPGPSWRPSGALRSTGRVWREHRRSAVVALALFVVGYVLAQVVGYGVGVLVPPFTGEGAALRFDYGAFALQGVATYAVVTASASVYADRIRRRAIAAN